MAQDPDIFNLKMREDADFVSIRTTEGRVITKGEAQFIADKLARALLFKGFRRGDIFLIIANDPTKALLSEFACVLAGFPHIYRGTHKNRMDLSYVKQITDQVDLKYIITDDIFDELLTSQTVSEITDFPEATDIAIYSPTSGTTTGIPRFAKFTRNDCAKKSSRYEGRKDKMCYTVFDINTRYVYTYPMTMMVRNTGVLLSDQSKETNWNYILNNINEYGVDFFATSKEISENTRVWETSSKNPFNLCSIEKYKALLKAADEVELDHMISYRPHGKSGKKEYLDILFELETKHPNFHCLSNYSGHDYTWIFQGDPNDTLYNRIYKTFHISELDNGRLGKLDPVNHELLVSVGIKTDYATANQPIEDGYIRTGDIFDLDENGYMTIKGRI